MYIIIGVLSQRKLRTWKCFSNSSSKNVTHPHSVLSTAHIFCPPSSWWGTALSHGCSRKNSPPISSASHVWSAVNNVCYILRVNAQINSKLQSVIQRAFIRCRRVITGTTIEVCIKSDFAVWNNMLLEQPIPANVPAYENIIIMSSRSIFFL